MIPVVSRLKALVLLPIVLAVLRPSLVATDAPAAGSDLVTRAGTVVRATNGTWRIEGSRHTARFAADSLALAVVVPGGQWTFEPSRPGDLIVRVGGERVSLQLGQAGSRSVTPYRTGYAAGIRVALGGFRRNDEPLDLGIQFLLTLDGPEEDLRCEILVTEGAATAQEMRWPGPVESAAFDHSVVPFMQGMFLPKVWPEKVWLYDTLCFGRGLYQPWWGHQQEGRALLALLETPDDAGCHFEHPPGGPTRMGPRWVSSLGRWSYPRRVRFCFLEGDYVATTTCTRTSSRPARRPAVGKGCSGWRTRVPTWASCSRFTTSTATTTWTRRRMTNATP